MNQTKRTLVFAAVAGCSLAVAAATNHLTKPEPLTGFENIGEEFYPEFTDPSAAASIRVAAYDNDTALTNLFSVEYKDGQWRIPSHHYYPADAKDQLAKTASSVIGIKRGALVSRRPSDHERFGVIDPLNKDETALKGRGKRLSLFDEKGNALVDLIIGDKHEDGTNQYYVRRYDEKATYLATVDVSLSTKFSDWVERDLLNLERDRLTSVEIHRPQLDDRQRIVGEDVLAVQRDASADPWKVTGSDEAAETVQTAEVNKLVSALDDLKLAGVRPKPRATDGEPLLTSDLSFRVPPEFANSPQLLQEIMRGLQADLARRGFFIRTDDKDNTRIYSKEGEVVATTDEGVRYSLYFGGRFTGDEEEIEIGDKSESDASSEKDPSEKADDASAETEAGDAAKNAESAEATPPADEQDDEAENGTSSRYLYVRVDFDESLLPDKPVAPQAPEKPAILQDDAEKSADQPSGETDAADKNDEAKPAEAKSEDAAADDAQPDAAAKPDPKAEAQAAYEQAMQKFNADLAQYERELKGYDDKLKAGREKVDELNERFGEWYYVISDASFQKLRPTRESLVKAKEEPAEPATEGTQPENASPAESPAAPAQNSPAQNSPAESAPAQDATEKPQDQPNSDAATQPKPAEDSKPAETPAANPAAGDSPAENPPAEGSPAETPNPTGETEQPAAEAPNSAPPSAD